jgi:hypothetical protein
LREREREREIERDREREKERVRERKRESTCLCRFGSCDECKDESSANFEVSAKLGILASTKVKGFQNKCEQILRLYSIQKSNNYRQLAGPGEPRQAP